MKREIPYIIEEFKNNAWVENSRPAVKTYAGIQYEVLVNMGRTIRCIYDGKVIDPREEK